MNIEALLNLMRREAMKAVGERGLVKIGHVSSYDPKAYACKVLLADRDADGNQIETGWLPIGAQAVGAGWGIFTPPSIHDQVDVHYVEGDHSAGYITVRIFQTGDVGANQVPSGEYWMIHNSGNGLKFTNDGKISLIGGTEIDIGKAGAFLPLVTSAFMAIFNGHTHVCATPGSASAVPTPLMTTAQLTTILKAN